MYQLTMEQQFNAPVARLFDAWCKVEIMKSWFAPGDMTVPHAEADLRVGGQYTIVMQQQSGEQHIVSGHYQEIVKNQKLVFSWQWKDSPNITQVSINFKAIDETHSALELTHSEFQEREACDKHQEGWNGCLANLHRIED